MATYGRGPVEEKSTGWVASQVNPRENRRRMTVQRFPALWLAAAFACLACAGRAPLAATPGTSTGPDSSTSPEAGTTSPDGTATPATSAAAGSAARPSAPLPGGEEPTPDKSLPELRIEPLGMHVGGGKNDPEEKAPFHRALERRFPAFLECYRLVEDPWAGGSFGIDIKIARAGGKPTVEQPRTKIRGAGFEQCMVAAVSSADFEKPKAGPTVISYSVRFTLVGSKPKR
jgi:hypothetical protein